MSEVVRLRRRWEAPDESMPPDREHPSFEAFFDDEKNRLLQALAVITGSRGEAKELSDVERLAASHPADSGPTARANRG
jgi:hypothetical protein